ncbi:MAG: radical SAM protein [Flavobacterium sp.]|nr:radical SAM protein [Flavobacterium sp.]
MTPKVVAIEINTECPSSCIMCPREEVMKLRRRAIMPTEQVYSLLNRIDWECMVEFAWLGEMFTDNRTIEFINFASKKGLGIIIDTNGYLLDREKLQLIMSNKNVLINFSIESAIPETYERIRKGLKFETVIQNYYTALDVRNILKSDTKIWVSRILIKGLNDSGKESTLFFEKFQDADHIQTNSYKLRGGKSDKGEVKALPSKNECNLIENYMAISVDGDVPLCCCDACVNILTGNVFEKDLLEIWNCELRKDTIQGIKEFGLQWFEKCQEVEKWS